MLEKRNAFRVADGIMKGKVHVKYLGLVSFVYTDFKRDTVFFKFTK